MMELTGLHFLLTYQCNYECDHCFVWGSPSQSGTMSFSQIEAILQQAKDANSIEWIYFEGGEPFLYYAVLLKAVKEAAGMGFKVGLVSNSYWATTHQDAQICLEPLAGLIQDLTVSSDLYHYSEKLSQEAQSAVKAAEQLGVPIYGIITVAQPEEIDAATAVGQLPQDESKVLYHGRAAAKLAPRAEKFTWTQFTECPYEDLRDPVRVHVDPLGYLHICQGITIGNLFHTKLREIIDSYDPDNHPISGPLLKGGPVELVTRYGLKHEEKYADACELCYKARFILREQFPQILAPDQMYGVFDS
jgi:MoaA/NifB/PqqE/SkfB family radical SAM enzyme